MRRAVTAVTPVRLSVSSGSCARRQALTLAATFGILDREIGEHLAGSGGERLVDAHFGRGEEVAQLQPIHQGEQRRRHRLDVDASTKHPAVLSLLERLDDVRRHGVVSLNRPLVGRVIRRRRLGDHHRKQPREVPLPRRIPHQVDHAGQETKLGILGPGTEKLGPLVHPSSVDHRRQQQLLARKVVQKPRLAHAGTSRDSAHGGAAISPGGELHYGGGNDSGTTFIAVSEPMPRARTTAHAAGSHQA